MPDYAIEEQFLARISGPIAGVDEVGRGPLAGPVLAAAVILDPSQIPEGLNDSKKLTMRKREALFACIMDIATVGIGEASVEEIDRHNIRRATLLAMARAVNALAEKPAFAIVDGNDPPLLACPCETIVRGDERCVSIAAASVVAKVARDRMMMRLDEEHPGYGWRRNMGYGTKEHLEGMQRQGITPHHRKSFAPVYHMLCPVNPGDSILKA